MSDSHGKKTLRSRPLGRWLESGQVFAQGWHEKGPLHFSTMVIERLVSPRVFDFGIIRIVGLDLPDSLPEEDAFAEIRWAGPEDLDRLSQLGIPRSQLEARFEQGQEALLREKAGRIAYVMLFGFAIARIGRRWTCRHLAPGQKVESSIDATRFP